MATARAVPTNGSLFRYNGCEFDEVPFEAGKDSLRVKMVRMSGKDAGRQQIVAGQ